MALIPSKIDKSKRKSIIELNTKTSFRRFKHILKKNKNINLGDFWILIEEEKFESDDIVKITDTLQKYPIPYFIELCTSQIYPPLNLIHQDFWHKYSGNTRRLSKTQYNKIYDLFNSALNQKFFEAGIRKLAFENLDEVIENHLKIQEKYNPSKYLCHFIELYDFSKKYKDYKEINYQNYIKYKKKNKSAIPIVSLDGAKFKFNENEKELTNYLLNFDCDWIFLKLSHINMTKINYDSALHIVNLLDEIVRIHPSKKILVSGLGILSIFYILKSHKIIPVIDGSLRYVNKKKNFVRPKSNQEIKNASKFRRSPNSKLILPHTCSYYSKKDFYEGIDENLIEWRRLKPDFCGCRYCNSMEKSVTDLKKGGKNRFTYLHNIFSQLNLIDKVWNNKEDPREFIDKLIQNSKEWEEKYQSIDLNPELTPLNNILKSIKNTL